MAIPILLWGVDASGRSFVENTNTVVINRRGAMARTKQYLNVGASLKVGIPNAKRVSSARVAWVGANREEYREIGIDLGQTGDFWNVRFPDDTLNSKPALSAAEQNSDCLAPNSFVASASKLEEPITMSSTPTPSPSVALPEMHMETLDKFLSAFRELAQSAMEKSKDNVLEQLNRQATENLNRVQRVMMEESQQYFHRAIEDAAKELETRAIRMIEHSQQVCEHTLQHSLEAAQERMETSLAKYEDRLAASARTIRSELASTMAGLSKALDRDQTLE